MYFIYFSMTCAGFLVKYGTKNVFDGNWWTCEISRLLQDDRVSRQFMWDLYASKLLKYNQPPMSLHDISHIHGLGQSHVYLGRTINVSQSGNWNCPFLGGVGTMVVLRSVFACPFEVAQKSEITLPKVNINTDSHTLTSWKFPWKFLNFFN